MHMVAFTFPLQKSSFVSHFKKNLTYRSLSIICSLCIQKSSVHIVFTMECQLFKTSVLFLIKSTACGFWIWKRLAKSLICIFLAVEFFMLKSCWIVWSFCCALSVQRRGTQLLNVSKLLIYLVFGPHCCDFAEYCLQTLLLSFSLHTCCWTEILQFLFSVSLL